jgi:hypothetical protein
MRRSIAGASVAAAIACVRDRLHANASSPTIATGLQIDVASLSDIIRSKTAAGRAKDFATLPQLRAALDRRQ